MNAIGMIELVVALAVVASALAAFIRRDFDPRRGPLVYCLEEVDNAGRRMQQLRLPRAVELRPVSRTDLFDGVVTMSMLCFPGNSCTTTSRTMGSPRPVPRPGGLVVKRGSKTWLTTSAGMP